MVQELAKHGDLFDALQRNSGTFPELQAAQVIAPLLTSLAYLHSQNILHRDIKVSLGWAQGQPVSEVRAFPGG